MDPMGCENWSQLLSIKWLEVCQHQVFKELPNCRFVHESLPLGGWTQPPLVSLGYWPGNVPIRVIQIKRCPKKTRTKKKQKYSKQVPTHLELKTHGGQSREWPPFHEISNWIANPLNQLRHKLTNATNQLGYDSHITTVYLFFFEPLFKAQKIAEDEVATMTLLQVQ